MSAAKALVFLVEDSGAAKALTEGGAVRALLQMFDFKMLQGADLWMLYFSLEAIMAASPDAAAQLVAAYADPDPWIAFAAIQSSTSLLLGTTDARAHLLQAGAASAHVAALSHDSPDCRGAAAHVALMASDGELQTALRAAGMVPAMI